MKNYFLYLLRRFVTITATLVALQMLNLMLKELVTWNLVKETVPEWIVISVIVFLIWSVAEYVSLTIAAYKQRVPVEWVIKALFELKWDKNLVTHSPKFKDKYEIRLKNK